LKVRHGLIEHYSIRHHFLHANYIVDKKSY